MWLFASKGFLSIVAHRYKPEYLLVRARKMSHLKALFPNADHYSDPDADYPHRAVIHRSIIANMFLDYIMNLKYDNFKSSVYESDYLHACHDVWSLMDKFGSEHRGGEL